MKILFFLLLSIFAYAVSAFPGVITFKQSDGETFNGHLTGDEWLNYVSLPNDFIAVYNKDTKNYEYALIQVKDGKSSLISSHQKVKESLHLDNPGELAETIPSLDKKILSTLERKTPHRGPTKQVPNKNIHKAKSLDTKSTQWKEILKEKTPSE